MKKFSFLAASLALALFMQSASAQELPTPEQRLQILLFPILVAGSLAISVAISAALYKSSNVNKKIGKR
jgi:hypothetical protein